MKKYAPDIYPGMTRAEYDGIEAINISLLLHGLKTMAHLREQQQWPSPPTAALVFGQAAHVALYEPELLEKLVIRKPEFTGKGARIARAEWLEENKHKIILDYDDYAACILMRDALRRNGDVRSLIESRGSGEVSFVWVDKETGLLCKGRIDRYCEAWGYNIISDLKSCMDASRRGFKRQVANFHYHVKASWYLNGLDVLQPAARRFVWVAVEKKPPFAAALYEPDDDSLAEGRRVYRRLLNRYAECLKADSWPSYPSGIEPLELEHWAYTAEPAFTEE